MATTFQALDYFLFLAVLLVSALIGIYYLLKEKWQKKESTSDDILMGGREMHVFPVAMSLIASYMSAITVLGIPTEMYVFGTQYFLVVFSGLLTYPVTCQIFLPFFHNLGLTSAYQYLEFRFNRTTRVLASLIFAIEMILYMAVVLYAPALALNQVTGLSLWGSILSVGVVVTFYTSMGGLRAVLWTDTFQTFVVVGGLIGIITIGSNRLGGVGEVWRISNQGGRILFFNFDPSPFERCTFWGLTIGSFIGQLTIYGANQTMLQRYMSISNVRKSKIALMISLPVTILLVSIVCMAGLVIFATYHDCDPLIEGKLISRDQLLPYYVMETLGNLPGIPGLFVACIFSAALSSISSCLNALSITLLEDIIKPILEICNRTLLHSGEARLAKLLGVIGGVVVIALAFLSTILGTTVLQIMISVLGMAGGPLLGLFLMGMFLPCVNSKGAVSGIIVSTFVTFWIVIGSYVYHAPLPELPYRSDGCKITSTLRQTFGEFIINSANLEQSAVLMEKSVIPENSEWSGLKLFYTISFLWYPTVAVGISLVTGILVSCCTGWTKNDINPRFIYPVAENCCCCLPAAVFRGLNCIRMWKYGSGKVDSIVSDDEEDVIIDKRELTNHTIQFTKPPKLHLRQMENFETEIVESKL
ncbi:hypothetical protein ACJMK2_039324 [Sinanodonta woodiana]|uniref:Sodium-coupled monocarboxylate transporter 1 n=1 Tax=Sinanodonta woodiana TaxID=1069815 RepID=A0ABD3WBT8_SINWO